MQEIHSHFTALDWSIIATYLLLTTVIGHQLRGKQASISDFFAAGRRLPWPAVCGSIIATEISALTFIGVPGMVFAAGGDFTYLQWAIGSILARCLVGLYFVPFYYEREIYSPYDFVGARLGAYAKQLITVLFFIGSILGQSVRVLVTALILRTVTGFPFEACIVLIGLFAVAWALMGGMQTVIWTDVIQFFIFVCGGVLALSWIICSIDGGLGQILSVGSEAGKLKMLDLRTDPTLEFTLWVGIFAMPFQNLAAFGTDQLNAQRMFCCRNVGDARKAIIWSSVSQLVTVLMLCVGVALFVYYAEYPMSEPAMKLIESDHDYVFPVWICTVLPPGISGLILAGAFAAAISSLDSILAALSQTSLSLAFGQESMAKPEQARKMLLYSRLAIVFWGVALSVFSIALDSMRGNINMVQLAFGVVTYTYGPMLGIFLLAISPFKVNLLRMTIGVCASALVVLYVRPDVYAILGKYGLLSPEAVALYQPKITFAWFYPVTCLITFVSGISGWRNAKD